MILIIISGLTVGFFLAYSVKCKKDNKKIKTELSLSQSQAKRLLNDFDNSQKERDRLLDRNSCQEERLQSFIKDNESLVDKNGKLSIYFRKSQDELSLAKEECNKLKFKVIQLEESMKLKEKVVTKSNSKPKETLLGNNE